MELINPHGNLVIVDSPQFERIKKHSDFDKYHRPEHVFRGNGPANRICTVTQAANEQQQNGLGDDFHAMPAVFQKVRDGFDVVVVGRGFTRECWEAVGATFVDKSLVGLGYVDDHLNDFGTIYSARQWCVRHDEDTNGEPVLTRFEQFARFIETDLPAEFSWRDAFNVQPVGAYENQPIALSLESLGSIRSYPKAQSLIELAREQFGDRIINISRVGGGTQFNDLRHMIEVLLKCRLVVSVDTGILAVALALGIPTLALMGPTSESVIVDQYERYLPHATRNVLRSTIATNATIATHGCMRPCNMQAARGWCVERNGRVKCGDFADCLNEIEPSSIVEAMLNC